MVVSPTRVDANHRKTKSLESVTMNENTRLIPQKVAITGYDSDGVVPLNYSSQNQEEQHAGFDLSAVLHKRRGGLGWKVENNWVPRLFTLYSSVLCYYETSDLKSADPSRPRNRINLLKEETITDIHIKHKNGAPSDFLIILNVYAPLGGKRRWEICCNSREQQEEWYEALRRFDGKPMHRSPNKKKIMFNTFSNAVHTYSEPSHAAYVDSIDEIKERAGILSIPFITFMSREERDRYIVLSFGIMNAAAMMMRFGSTGAFWISLLISNLCVSYLCAHVTTKSIKKLLDDNDVYDGDDQGLGRLESFSTVVEAGSTFKRAKPKSDELKNIIEEHGMKSAVAIKACAGATTDFEELPHTYWNVESSRFHLRVGPNYKKNKQKAPSATALYDLYAMDLVKATSNLERADKGFEIPDIPGVTDIPTGHAYVPSMIVLVVNIPSGEPSMFQTSTCGPCYVAVLYLVITDETRKALSDLENASPAVKLLAEWCQHAENDDTWKGRFKFLALLDNIESLGLPSFIAGFNGKPVLINKSGKFTRHSNYIEMTINVHAWAFVARKGLHTLLPKFPEFIVNVGATIEGRNDEEQPECLLGGVRAMYINPDKIHLDSNQ